MAFYTNLYESRNVGPSGSARIAQARAIGGAVVPDKGIHIAAAGKSPAAYLPGEIDLPAGFPSANRTDSLPVVAEWRFPQMQTAGGRVPRRPPFPPDVREKDSAGH